MRTNIFKNKISKKSLLIGMPLALFGAIVGMPLVAEAATTTTTVSSVVGQAITVSSSGTVNIDATPTASGVQTIGSDTVTVSTNDSAGYTLKLGETTATTTLTSGGNTIAATTGTQAAPVVETANSWGYRVDGVGGFGAGPTTSASSAAISGTIKFAPVAASGSPNTIKTTAVVASSDTTTVWYGVAVNSTAVAGTYTNSVTYTATAN
jgi:hypothetical protein